MNDRKEVLIKCVDCHDWPNSCGYWKSKHKKHTCKGFKSARGMTLKETLYNLRNTDVRGAAYNSQVIPKAIEYLNELVDFRRNKKIEEDLMEG